MISSFIKKISKNNFNKAIFTYEGHSYERNIINQLKKHSNRINVFAYLHSGFMKQVMVFIKQNTHHQYYQINIFLVER